MWTIVGALFRLDKPVGLGNQGNAGTMLADPTGSERRPTDFARPPVIISGTSSAA
jgi:hypothetical protein